MRLFKYMGVIEGQEYELGNKGSGCISTKKKFCFCLFHFFFFFFFFFRLTKVRLTGLK